MEVQRDTAVVTQATQAFREAVSLAVADASADPSSTTDSSSSISPAPESEDVTSASPPALATDPSEQAGARLDEICVRQKVGFVDLAFPPTAGSLLGPLERARRQALLGPEAAAAALVPPKLRHLVWKRRTWVIV